MLMELASRVMAGFAAVPEAASAVSVLLPPISIFLGAVGDSTPECAAQHLAGARRSLLASAQLLLWGPSSLPTAASVAAHGPVTIGEAAMSALAAIRIAMWHSRAASPVGSRLATQLLKQCRVKRRWLTPASRLS